MKLNIISFILVLGLFQNLAIGQSNETNTIKSWNEVEQDKGSLLIGGYGEVHYNQNLNADYIENGKLDVHRLVLLFGYNFSKKLSFFSEVEFEHVKEVYVEQAFANYKINNALNLKAGLLLTPMGLINEYHEPPLFFSVERPTLDKLIVPTTWREIGFGASGNITSASLKYQLYLMNGFKSYDGTGLLSGAKGMRSARQKGAESIISNPNLAGKIDYYGIPNLKIGASIFTGKTQSSLYKRLDKNDDYAVSQADSSIVNTTMLGLDLRFRKNAFILRGQFNYIINGNVDQYNTFTNQDLSTNLMGYYAEVGYNVFRHTKFSSQLIPFVRYEYIDTHAGEESANKNESYEQSIITTGLNWKLNDGFVLKSDIQFQKAINADDYNTTLNIGFGVWFR